MENEKINCFAVTKIRLSFGYILAVFVMLIILVQMIPVFPLSSSLDGVGTSLKQVFRDTQKIY